MPLQPNGSLATTLVITKGLPCGNLPVDREICSFGAGITPWFSLYCETVVPPKPKKKKCGLEGGSHPLLPGEIQNFYTQLPTEQQFYVVPKELEAQYFARYQNITLKVKIGEKEIEKVFRVPENRSTQIVKVLSAFNSTKEKIVIEIDNIKRITSQAIVKIKNLRLRRK